MLATIDLRLLSTLVAVADALSFSRAARALGTTTATVSRDVARLEALVGSRLLHRTTRQVALTTAGTALYERTAVHLRALRSVARELPEQQAEPAGTLKLTAPLDLGRALLGGLVARFTLRYPWVRVLADFNSRALDLVGEGFDLAIRGDAWKRADPSWAVRKLLGATELHFFAAPGYLARRGAPRAVGAPEHAWLVATPMRRLLEVPEGFEPAIEGNDFLFLREAARAGGGVAMLPSVLAREEVASGDLVRVLPQVAPRVGGLMLLYPATRPLARKISVFRDFLLEAVARGWPE